MEFVRTPEERFAEVPDFPWEPHWLDSFPGYDGLRMHYLDEGPADGRVFLCLHGEPTWSFLYRKMIPVFLESGARVVAPDFFGFGKSDKPIDDEVYTFDFHRGSLVALIEELDLQRITLVCQDWGGVAGLTLPPDMPERFERLIVMNTALATGEGTPSPGFIAWKSFMASQPDVEVGRLMKRAVPGIRETEAAAYDAPFPDERSKAGVRRFPAIVPLERDDPGAAISRRAARWWREEFDGDSFMAIGEQDPVLGPPVMQALRATIRDCPEPLLLKEAGHFVQESGDVVAREALHFFGDLD